MSLANLQDVLQKRVEARHGGLMMRQQIEPPRDNLQELRASHLVLLQ